MVGRSVLVGKPMAQLLLARHATVTICHSRTRDLAEVCRRADVLVVAVGIPRTGRRRRRQARRDRHRRRHPPRRERPARGRRLRRGRRGGGRDHPGAGRGRPDDDRDAAGQHPHRCQGPAGHRGLMARPWARFDDLRAGTSLRCPPPSRILTATRPDEVAGVLQQVHDATEAGSWAFGYVAYEAAAGLDPQLPGGSASPGEPPLVWFGLCDEPARVEPLRRRPRPRPQAAPWRPDWTDDEHARAVASVREHIAAGETYQCNLTDRLRSTVAGDPQALYARLALAQRGAYNAYLDLGGHVVASASPELFFEWAGDVVRTRPMKGTAPRGRTTAEDREQSRLPAVQQQGAGREPDDRRSAAQRPRPGGRGRQRGRGRALRPGALPDRLADDLAGERPGPGRHRAAGPVPRVVPVRIGHRRSEAPHDAADRRAGADAAGGLLRRRRDWSLLRPPRSGPGSTSPSGPSSSTAPPARPCTGRAAASPGGPRRRRNGPSCMPRRPCWPTT